MRSFDTRFWTVAAVLAIASMATFTGACGGDPAGDPAEYEAAKAGGVPGLVAWVKAGGNLDAKQARCAKIYADLSALRDPPLRAALASPTPDVAFDAWKKENEALILGMDVCGVSGTAARDALAKMADVAEETSRKGALTKEMDADLTALAAAGDDRFKAWGLIATGRADKRKVHLEDARGPLPALMLDKYFEVFAGPLLTKEPKKSLMGATADEVKKAWGEPATKKPVEGALDEGGATVPTEEWTYPDRGVLLAVIQGTMTLERLIVGEGWTEPIFGVQIGDNIASSTSNMFGALAAPGEVLGKEKVRLAADPDYFVEFAVWIDKDGVVERISLANKSFYPYGPRDVAGKPPPGAPAPGTAAGSAKPGAGK